MLRLALALLLLCTAAHAETANQRAENEAQSYLAACPSNAPLCVVDQKQFVDSYILSEAGETYFMGDIIGFLDPLPSPYPSAAVRPDRVKACAWRYVRWKLGEPPVIADIYRRDWAAHCVNSSDVDIPKQRAEILTLINDLKTSPTEITPRLAAIRDHYAPMEPLAAALIEKVLPPGSR